MSAHTPALVSRLLAARNADGGWPYLPGRSSRLEPTCTALIALGSAGQPPDAGVLERWPRRDGLFLDSQAGTLNYGFNGVAALALAAAGESELAGGLAGGLVRERGVELPVSNVNRQDNSIRAWSWAEDVFSWVEPTAWCLLGLKRLLAAGHRPAGADTRVEDGERLLRDRACLGGGWNHGNSNMLGVELAAYVPTTAVALLALRDRRADTVVGRSLEYLRTHHMAERSAMALGLAGICLRVYGGPGELVADISSALAAEWSRTAYMGNLHTTALALCALSGDTGVEAFRA